MITTNKFYKRLSLMIVAILLMVIPFSFTNVALANSDEKIIESNEKDVNEGKITVQNSNDRFWIDEQIYVADGATERLEVRVEAADWHPWFGNDVLSVEVYRNNLNRKVRVYLQFTFNVKDGTTKDGTIDFTYAPTWTNYVDHSSDTQCYSVYISSILLEYKDDYGNSHKINRSGITLKFK